MTASSAPDPSIAAMLADHGGDAGTLVAEGIARARTAWAGVVLDDGVMTDAIARALAGTSEPLAALRDLFIEDLFLAQACAAGDPCAVTAFAKLGAPAIDGALRAMRLPADAIADLAQEVYEKLLVGATPKIATYSGRASLTTWVRTVATRAAVSQLRRRSDEPTDDEVLAAIPAVEDSPELAHFRDSYRVEFKEAFEQALASLEVRERNVLRHHFVDRLTIEQIGGLYDVHKTTAFRWLEAARNALSKRTMKHFQARVRATPAEMQSIVRLLESNVELSLSRVLA